MTGKKGERLSVAMNKNRQRYKSFKLSNLKLDDISSSILYQFSEVSTVLSKLQFIFTIFLIAIFTPVYIALIKDLIVISHKLYILI